VISAAHLSPLQPQLSVEMERAVVVVGGADGGESDGDTLLKALCAASVNTANRMKTSGLPQKAAPARLACFWKYPFLFLFPVRVCLPSCEFMKS